MRDHAAPAAVTSTTPADVGHRAWLFFARTKPSIQCRGHWPGMAIRRIGQAWSMIPLPWIQQTARFDKLENRQPANHGASARGQVI